MFDQENVLERRERVNAVVRAVVVVVCYMIVFTGLLMTVASAGQ